MERSAPGCGGHSKVVDHNHLAREFLERGKNPRNLQNSSKNPSCRPGNGQTVCIRAQLYLCREGSICWALAPAAVSENPCICCTNVKNIQQEHGKSQPRIHTNENEMTRKSHGS